MIEEQKEEEKKGLELEMNYDKIYEMKGAWLAHCYAHC